MNVTLVVSDLKYLISFFNNFTFYKWCVTKVAHCICLHVAFFLWDVVKQRKTRSDAAKPPNNPKLGNGQVQLITVGKSIRLKWVKSKRSLIFQPGKHQTLNERLYPI